MITSRTATLIDNIFTNSYSKQTAGLILTDVSDHLPIFISTNLTVYQNDDKGTKVNARDVSDENIRNFKNKLCQADWDNVCNSKDVDVSYSCFIDKFNSLYNECFPIKSLKKRIPTHKPKSPWITYSLLKSIRRKNLLYRKSIQKLKSDHSIVSCKVLTKDCPKGKGYWKLGCHYLRHDAHFVSFIKSKISEFKEIHEDTDCNPHVILDAFKCTITGHCIQYCSRMKKDKL